MKLRLHVRTTWLPWSDRTKYFWCVDGLPKGLRTTWQDTSAQAIGIARRYLRGECLLFRGYQLTDQPR